MQVSSDNEPDTSLLEGARGRAGYIYISIKRGPGDLSNFFFFFYSTFRLTFDVSSAHQFVFWVNKFIPSLMFDPA